MSMAYFGSFDVRKLDSANVTFTKSGGATFSVRPNTMGNLNGFSSTAYVYNAVMTNGWAGFDYGFTRQLKALTQYTFYEAFTVAARAAATTAGWASPDTITVSLNTTTRRVNISYSGTITAITFGSVEVSYLMGHGGADFSGSSSSITGAFLPWGVIEPTIPGASSAGIIEESEQISASAQSGTGRIYSFSRTVAPMRRQWVQQYEPATKAYRRSTALASDYSYQQLFEDCRTGLPFAVFDGFGDGNYTAYSFESGADAFHPLPASPGNAELFHIPFRCVALGQPVIITFEGDVLTIGGDPILFGGA